MGLFWAEPAPAAISKPDSASILAKQASPPPSCPMHNKSTVKLPTKTEQSIAGTNMCPYEGRSSPSSNDPPSSPPRSTVSALNPLNWMPNDISQTMESTRQKKPLPVERETSSIPRAATGGESDLANWEYPSPQQMYNALVRKGFTDTPEDAVESMVAIHNFLNEGAWGEIVEWERRFSRGLIQGWRECKYGEEGSQIGVTTNPSKRQEIAPPKLLRFMGRSQDITPKARMLQVLGWMYPTKYGGPPPFDRHDWFVERTSTSGQSQPVRYVIDYYSGPPEPTGQPVFYLDIRPALDRPAAPAERLIRWTRDFWWRASGAGVRETPSRQ